MTRRGGFSEGAGGDALTAEGFKAARVEREAFGPIYGVWAFIQDTHLPAELYVKCFGLRCELC